MRWSSLGWRSPPSRDSLSTCRTDSAILRPPDRECSTLTFASIRQALITRMCRTPSVSSSPSTSAIGPAPLLALPAAIAEPAEPPYFPALPPAIPAAQPVRSPSPLSQRSSSVMSPSSSYQSAMEGRRMSGLRNQHFPEVYS